jgi:hypothetical protein
MSATVAFKVRSPITGLLLDRAATLDVKVVDAIDGTGIQGLLVVDGRAEYDITQAVNAALKAKPTSPPANGFLTYLRTLYDDPANGLVLNVYDNTGFTVGDIVLLVEDFDRTKAKPTATAQVQALVAAKGGSSSADYTVTLLLPAAATSLGRDYDKHSYLIRMKDAIYGPSAATNKQRGAKAVAEAPTAPSFTATNIATLTLRFLIDNPHLSGADIVRSYFDVYVRPNPVDEYGPLPNWTPDSLNNAFTDLSQPTLQVDVTTHSGGALTTVWDQDLTVVPTVATLETGKEYWVMVIRKDVTGTRQLVQPNESLPYVIRRIKVTQ